MSNVYDFDRQRELGADGESVIRELFSRLFRIVNSASHEQREGIDFWFSHGGFDVAVEVKTDFTAGTTGNAFIETTSVDTSGKPGWAYSSRADFLLYYVPPNRVVYIMPMREIRKLLPVWLKRYERRKIRNSGYFTEGVLVPLDQFSCHVMRVTGSSAEAFRARGVS